MKIWSQIILAVALIGSVVVSHPAAASTPGSITLQWQSSPDSRVAGYALYYGAAGSPMTNRLDIGNSTATTLQGLSAATSYYFFVVAYDASQLESDPSNFLLYTAPKISNLQLSQGSGGNMDISFQVAPGANCHVEYTATLNPPNWTVLTTAVADSNGAVTVSDPIDTTGAGRFYRAVVP